MATARITFKTDEINRGFSILEGKLLGAVQIALEEAASEAALVYIFPLVPERTGRLETSAQKKFLGVGAGTAAVAIMYAATDPETGEEYAPIQETQYPHKNTTRKTRAQMLFLTEGIENYGQTQYVADVTRQVEYLL